MIDTNIGKKIAIALAVLAVIIAAIYLVPRVREKAPPGVQQVPEETRSVTIFFGDGEAESFVSETREVPVTREFEEQVKLVMAELIRGSDDKDKMNAIPDSTELVQVFWVEDTQLLILDFNKAFTANHPGGSTGEYYTISTILKTVSANFPQVGNVQFLVEGEAIESIAGHFAADKPIDVKKWR